MSKFDKASERIIEKKFATYTLKISHPLFTKFKIKSLTDKDATYRETLTRLIEEYVQT
jgi:DNA-directed RNA polymerase subunit L